jgi:primase-polymerase (primpol)-like protein
MPDIRHHATNIPEELRARKQWVIWRRETRNGKSTKVPHTTMGYRAAVNNPEHWSTFGNACKAASRSGFAEGTGFVFSPEDPYCGIDLDDVWQSDASEGTAWGWEILARFADTYLEQSPSGNGVKIWCRAKASHCGPFPFADGKIEIYDHARFFAVTGRAGRSHSITDHQADVDSLIAYLGAKISAAARAIGEKIPYGTQHHTLVSLAGTMWHRGMLPEAIEAALQITNARQCEKPGTAEEIHGIVERITRYAR